jgi:hypothetical protein
MLLCAERCTSRVMAESNARDEAIRKIPLAGGA